jgi:tRNA-specific adenosine deaminase 1
MSVTASLIAPNNAYIRRLIIPRGRISSIACERAFSAKGRLSGVAEMKFDGGYSFQPFEVCPTDKVFQFSRFNIEEGITPVPNNVSSMWTPNTKEILINGLIQGKKLGNRGATSVLCKRQMFEKLHGIAATLRTSGVDLDIGHDYEAFKNSTMLASRQRVKDVVRQTSLQGWVRNPGNSFALDV